MLAALSVAALYRYPVKSMAGEMLESARVTKRGFHGDRNWAVYNTAAREIQGGRNLPKLLQLKAEYVREPIGDDAGAIRIIFPDETFIETERAIESDKLSEFVGAPTRLMPLEPATNVSHYLRARTTPDELRKQMGVAEGEANADFSSLSLSALATGALFATPPGAYYDLYPLHIMTVGALAFLKNISGNANFRVERFRPNILVQNSVDTAVEEFSWNGLSITMQNVRLKIEAETVRCSIPGRAQPGVAEDKTIVQAVARLSNRHLGVYASVANDGMIRRGDAMEIHSNALTDLQQGFDRAVRELKKGILGRVLG